MEVQCERGFCQRSGLGGGSGHLGSFSRLWRNTKKRGGREPPPVTAIRVASMLGEEVHHFTASSCRGGVQPGAG